MLVVSCFSDGLMKFVWFVAGFLINFEESDSETGGCEHLDGKVKRNWWFYPSLIFGTCS